MVRWLRTLWFLPFICHCDCEPTFEMSGTVHYDNGTPAVARVLVLCDDRFGPEAVSDEDDGEFEGSSCNDEVTAACRGTASATDTILDFDPMEYCVDRDGPRCARMRAELRLPPGIE